MRSLAALDTHVYVSIKKSENERLINSYKLLKIYTCISDFLT